VVGGEEQKIKKFK